MKLSRQANQKDDLAFIKKEGRCFLHVPLHVCFRPLARLVVASESELGFSCECPANYLAYFFLAFLAGFLAPFLGFLVGFFAAVFKPTTCWTALPAFTRP